MNRRPITSNLSRLAGAVLAGTAVMVMYSPAGNATPYTVMPRADPCDPAVSGPCRLPTPIQVSGKEYSHNEDIDDTQPTPFADPEQVLAWDGIGGRQDTFDYSGSRADDDTQDRQTDALANQTDALYIPVINDQVWLLFSTDSDPNIYYENPGSATGGVWAIPSQIDRDGDTVDVDGLEVWGEDLVDDANRYSVIGDGAQAGNTDISVWHYDGANSAALWSVQEIIEIVSDVTGISTGDLSGIDLDAMMTNDDMDIMFSVDPISTLDGGEIFVATRDNGFGSWNSGAGDSASYLTHGGHLWDTAFEVQGTYNTASENVNALEAVAVPAPATLALMGLGLAGLGGLRRRCAKH